MEEELERLVYSFVLLVFFIAFTTLLNFFTRLHELGHAMTCYMTGGEVKKLSVNATLGITACDWAEGPTAQQYLLYRMGGILAEFLFALTLLAIPWTCALGGYAFYVIGASFLYGSYVIDFKNSEFEFLLLPNLRILIFLASLLIFLISLSIYIKFWGDRKA